FKIIDVSFIDFFKRISPIFVSSLLMVLFLYALSIIYPVNDIANLLVLVLFAVAGAFVYILALFLVSSDFRSYFIARVLKRH
ncbi:TPA: flippase, partial [Klebsiella pneumoniae]|nr:flippase [Klebsiella pneumoniae]